MITLPTSWTVYNSWVKAKSLWNKMNRSGGVKYPKYHDFKVLFNVAHYTAFHFASNLMPRDGDLALFSSIGREWQPSQFVTPEDGGSQPALEHACHMLGADSGFNNPTIGTDGSFAIIQGYGDTRVTVGLREPELPGDASVSWQTALFDAGEVSGDIVDHLEAFNDQPPYAHALDAQEAGDNPIYVGGSESGTGGHRFVDFSPVGPETIYAAGGEVPCGLMQVTGEPGGILSVTVGLGPYKGVMAMPMQKVPT